jgi:hypothetical protein
MTLNGVLTNEGFLYFVFFCGQMLYVLKRMSYAIRSPLNPVSKRRDYLHKNWDVLLIRTVLDGVLFVFWQHGQLATYITNHTTYTMPEFLQSGPTAAGLLGYFSDAMADWFLTLKFMPDFLKRVVPMVPANGDVKKSLEAAAVAADRNVVSAQKTVDAVSDAKDMIAAKNKPTAS